VKKQTYIVNHPLLQHSLTILRDRTTDTETFKRHAAVVSNILIVQATYDLALHEKPIQTPLAAMIGKEVDKSLVLVPVLRAGLSMLFAAREFLPWASVGFIGLERDEQTAAAREYYQKFPADLAHRRVIILDPMLATGGSLVETIAALQHKGAVDVRAVCIVAAPEGIDFVHQKYPSLPIYTAAVDSHLNDVKYIVPGLGDFGDRYFGT
jgi:uracil phosphoribosyltransferase